MQDVKTTLRILTLALVLVSARGWFRPQEIGPKPPSGTEPLRTLSEALEAHEIARATGNVFETRRALQIILAQLHDEAQQTQRDDPSEPGDLPRLPKERLELFRWAVRTWLEQGDAILSTPPGAGLRV